MPKSTSENEAAQKIQSFWKNHRSRIKNRADCKKRVSVRSSSGHIIQKEESAQLLQKTWRAFRVRQTTHSRLRQWNEFKHELIREEAAFVIQLWLRRKLGQISPKREFPRMNVLRKQWQRIIWSEAALLIQSFGKGYFSRQQFFLNQKKRQSRIQSSAAALVVSVLLAVCVATQERTIAAVANKESSDVQDSVELLAKERSLRTGWRMAAYFDRDAVASEKYRRLRRAVVEGDYDTVTLMIHEGVPVNSKVNNNKSLLHLAVQESTPDIVHRFLYARADPNALDHYSRRTPLHYAVRRNNIHLVQLLTEYSASPAVCDVSGRTPLIMACEDPGTEFVIIERLISEEQEQQLPATSSYLKLFLLCATSGRVDALRHLLDHGYVAINDHCAEKDGNTALHSAALAGHVDAVSFLLSRNANVHAENGYGETALHLATHSEASLDVLSLLHAAGANVSGQGSVLQFAPLDVAALSSNERAVERLVGLQAEIRGSTREMGLSSTSSVTRILRMLKAKRTAPLPAIRKPVAKALGGKGLDCPPLECFKTKFNSCAKPWITLSTPDSLLGNHRPVLWQESADEENFELRKAKARTESELFRTSLTWPEHLLESAGAPPIQNIHQMKTSLAVEKAKSLSISPLKDVPWATKSYHRNTRWLQGVVNSVTDGQDMTATLTKKFSSTL